MRHRRQTVTRTAWIAVAWLSASVMGLIGCRPSHSSPDAPDALQGPEYVLVDSTYTFSTTAQGPEGVEQALMVSWRDSSPMLWSAMLPGGTHVVWHKTWRSAGSFPVRVRARNAWGDVSDWSQDLRVHVLPGESLPLPPMPTAGPAASCVGLIEDFACLVRGVPGESLRLILDWGDSSTSGQSQAVAPGETIRFRHAYWSPGTYDIRARVQDVATEETSVWSQPLRIDVRRSAGTEWQLTFAGTAALSVAQAADGDFLVAGDSSDDLGWFSVPFLARTSPTGGLVWCRVYRNDTVSFRGNSVLETADGGYVVVGAQEGWDIGTGIYILRTDKNGEPVWLKKYFDDLQYGPRARRVLATPDGGYLVAAGSLIMKTDSAGDSVWTRPAAASALEPCSEGGYILGGWSREGPLLTRIDAQGNELWRGVLGEGDGWITAVCPTANQRCIVAGSVSWAGRESVFVTLVDRTGEPVWWRTLSGLDGAEVADVCLTPDGGCYAVGGTDYGLGYVARLGPAGNLLWERLLPSMDFCYANSALASRDAACIIAATDGEQAVLFRIDQQGLKALELPQNDPAPARIALGRRHPSRRGVDHGALAQARPGLARPCSR